MICSNDISEKIRRSGFDFSQERLKKNFADRIEKRRSSPRLTVRSCCSFVKEGYVRFDVAAEGESDGFPRNSFTSSRTNRPRELLKIFFIVHDSLNENVKNDVFSLVKDDGEKAFFDLTMIDGVDVRPLR